MEKAFEGIRTIGSALGRDAKDFFPELERVDAEALVGSTFKIVAIHLVDWDYESGQSGQFALAKVELPDGKFCTTILGGKAVLKQAKKLRDLRKLPVVAFLNLVSGANGDYRILQDPPDVSFAQVS